jgi:hypothetical protein
MQPTFFLIMLSAALSACATLTAEKTQFISVTTTPAGAACTLTNSAGEWKIPSTSGSVNVTRSVSRLVIRCKKEGLYGVHGLNAVVRDRSVWNALMGPAGAVDAYTGAGYEYRLDGMPITLQ